MVQDKNCQVYSPSVLPHKSDQVHALKPQEKTLKNAINFA